MRKKKIALFGGSFNPPHLYHRAVVKALAHSGQFDEIIIIPCGPRPDKMTTNDIDTVHRAAMVDMNFQGIPKTKVELFDLENASFTRTWELTRRYAAHGEVWHVVGSDFIQRGAERKSLIHTEWEQGEKVWKTCNFAVFYREDAPSDLNDLPPHSKLFRIPGEGSSSEVRERIFKRMPFTRFVLPEIHAYIERRGLYRGRFPGNTSNLSISDWDVAIKLIADQKNPAAMHIARRLRRYERKNPSLIVVVGGDGMMLRAIRKEWRSRLPFFGINAGHRGFLLNQFEAFRPEMLLGEWRLYQFPLLYVESAGLRGNIRSTLAYNDAWVQSRPGTAIWAKVSVNNRVWVPKLVSDGVLVATPGGSTAYARAMGATPLPLESETLMLVGSNVFEPAHWRSDGISMDSTITFESLDPTPIPKKRPFYGFVDGIPQGQIQSMLVRKSRVAAVELVLDPDRRWKLVRP